MLSWEISKEQSGTGLLSFLKQQLPAYSSKQLKKLLDSNTCAVNTRTERFGSFILGQGDKITLRVNLVASPAPAQSPSIIYEDDDLFIINKPYGISSEQLASTLYSKLPFLKLIHRLDKDTSGILLFAKSEAIFQKMVELFKERAIKKTYYAIADGIPKTKKGMIENYLGEKHRYQGQVIWGSMEKGLEAVTEWECESKSEDTCLIRCTPHTGRTHQLRVHLSEMGHPILGDHQYGRKFRSKYTPIRQLLHAYSLQFIHPVSGVLLSLTAPLPEEFMQAMIYLFKEHPLCKKS